MTAQPDLRSIGLAGKRDPTSFWSVLGSTQLSQTQHYWVLLGSRTQRY
jgi:hypothetical protein